LIEPRHLYAGSFGASLIIVLLIYAYTSKLKNSINSMLILLVIVLPIIVYHTIIIRSDIMNLVKLGNQRKKILESIKTDHPTLPARKVIFYTKSNTTYYGLSNNDKILPVQSGFGNMLAVWYYKEKNLPSCIYKGEFLYDILSQDYRECNGRGFGYFRDYDRLKQSVIVNSVPINNIISYSWNGNTEDLKDISDETRKRLSADLKDSI
jgi:hypothetical protein